MAACFLVAFILIVIIPKVLHVVSFSHFTCCVYTCCFCGPFSHSFCGPFSRSFCGPFSRCFCGPFSRCFGRPFSSYICRPSSRLLFLLAVFEDSCYFINRLLLISVSNFFAIFISRLLVVFIRRLLAVLSAPLFCFCRPLYSKFY